MLVSIFSDAGYCHTTGIASWGGWARSDRGIARSGGLLKIDSNNTVLLEAAAMVNAVKMSLIFKVLQHQDTMLLQTDNNMVDDILTGKVKGPLPGLVYGEFVRTCMHYGLDYEWRHVEGHKGDALPSNSVNSYCDRVCRFFLRLERHRQHPDRWPNHPARAPFGIKVPKDFADKIVATKIATT
jgi:ribonuclease HI